MRYIFDTGGKPLTEIFHPSICSNAAFKIDKPITCSPNDVFELIDGRWFLISYYMGEEEAIPLDGRWCPHA